MKNKEQLKKYMIRSVLFAVCFIIIFIIANYFEYRAYTANYNKKISAIVGQLLDKYPDLNETDIIQMLNDDSSNADEELSKYSIDVRKQSVLLENDRTFVIVLVIDAFVMLIATCISVFVFLSYDKRRNREVKDITKYIEQINKKNYDLAIDTISEDEMSILKNEIYKTTIMLKEAAENSNTDKVNLKKSLEDISHQLKTPLTSVLVMLDNLIDDPDMDKEVREDFIRSIKRELVNIKFLVQEILKLSKFDSNTINFIKKEVDIKKIIDESVYNVSALSDLKNVQIKIKADKNPKIYCDEKWQIEAITNLIKNCIDHSPQGSEINISYDDNNVYSVIKITDRGEGISHEDLPHIFERFYKGENATSDSLGIGLALAKTIVEEDSGIISVDSNEIGTTFTVKYFKKYIHY
ncbi:MAG: HAMP domain-containing histidine kinase [Lachnospiraceae bacterium]|nr:HAMP domain-containing histidine kinase [Lachnospiraceae bacterium]